MKRIIKTALPVFIGLTQAGCASAEPAGDQTPAQTPILEAMDFFVGFCWDGVFSDGQSTDRHCLAPMNKGHFVRDRHFVDGARGPYGGETVFGWNADKDRIDYVYFDTSGGRSEGSFVAVENGFAAPDEVYALPDGRSMTISSAWVVTGPDSWEQRTLDVSADTPKTLWTIAYTRAPLGTVEGLD
ncbi:MAG: hypothetical protein AAF311_00540 [Pseudomonadota bacterium]